MATRWQQLGAFVMVPMQVPSGALRTVIDGLRHIPNFAGAIVSMPHKSAIVALLDELTAEAQLIGAVNVVRRNNDGTLSGTVLDGEGFVAGLQAAGHKVQGANCLLVGAGGAATAIAFAIARHGCDSLTIQNRTPSKAEALALRVQRAFPETRVRSGDADRATYDVTINATSLGMGPDDPLPIPPEVIDRSRVVAECVVAAEITHLLQVAQRKGRVVHTGLPMLSAQMDLMLRFMGVSSPAA